jgi:transcriptional regulator with XRE-family HTH domain
MGIGVMGIGETIKRKRQELNQSQQKFAERVGVMQTTAGNWKRVTGKEQLERGMR